MTFKVIYTDGVEEQYEGESVYSDPTHYMIVENESTERYIDRNIVSCIVPIKE